MPLTLRNATLADSDLLLAWRNDPEVIATSASGKVVMAAEHEAWFIKTLTDLTVHLYVAETWVGDYGATLPRDPEPPGIWASVGMGRINEDCGIAVLSYSIAKEYRARWYGGQLVVALVQKAHELGFRSIQAVSRHTNTASIRALLSHGFTIGQAELLVLRRELR